MLRQNVPSVKVKRILDLGANNAFNAIQFLRDGARSAIGVGLDRDRIAQGELAKEAFEWADNTHYDFRYINSDMVNVQEMNMGKFDMETALNTIYYLDDQAIQDLVTHLSSITPVMVLQCNVGTKINRSDPHTYTKASVEYAKQTLANCGFPRITICAPSGYSRPVVIGYVDETIQES